MNLVLQVTGIIKHLHNEFSASSYWYIKHLHMDLVLQVIGIIKHLHMNLVLQVIGINSRCRLVLTDVGNSVLIISEAL